jgi:hypothetical protein
MIFLCLLPWIVLSTIAIATPLYPVMQGNVRPDFGIIGTVTWDEEIRWALQNLFTFSPLTSLALFFVAAAVLRPNPRPPRDPRRSCWRACWVRSL